MKRMLINATQPEECRLAIVDGQNLLDYETEIAGREFRKGNLYNAVVTRVEPSLEACFVDYGEERHGFLPFKEISRQYFQGNTPVSKAKIDDVIKDGQELLVQVVKEERGNKGAALTTFISLAGRYVVLMPNNPRGGGVSRRISGEERTALKAAMSELEYPKGMGIIARTAGIGRSGQELQWDLNYLLKVWEAVEGAAHAGKGAFLIYPESNLVIRAIRDYFRPDIGDILVDTKDVYEQAFQFMSHVMPEHAGKVKLYTDKAPLFSRFQIEHQVESAYSRVVTLPSGGSIVIDRAEALVAIDVNSARSIRGGDIEETATRTNLEAADEVARQLRLRDLGGLVVIDFIDMDESRNRREVESRLRDALREDRARVQFGSISKFGLMEMSRQRLKPALSEGASILCPRCGGAGHIRDTESSALQILRIIQEESMKDNTAAVHVQVPVDVASFLLNEKRSEVRKIEVGQRIDVVLIPNRSLLTPHYELERLRYDDPRLDDPETSYKMVYEREDETTVTRRSKEPTNRQTPVLKGVIRDVPAPQVAAKTAAPATPIAAPKPAASAPAGVPAGAGFLAWLKGIFASPQEAAKVVGQRSTRETAGSKTSAARDNDRRQQKPDKRKDSGAQRRQGKSSSDEAPKDGRPERRRDQDTEELQDDDSKRNRNRNRRRRNRGGRNGRSNDSRRNSERNQNQQGTDRERSKPSPDREADTVKRAAAAAKPSDTSAEKTRSAAEEAVHVADRHEETRQVRLPESSGEQAVSYFDRGSRAQVSHADKPQEQEQASEQVESRPASAAKSVPETSVPEVSAEKQQAESAPVQAQASKPEKQAQTFELPLDSLQQLATQAGLQWVQSDQAKVQALQAIHAAQAKPPHVPRERPALPPMEDEVLTLVETRLDLREHHLTFEAELQQ